MAAIRARYFAASSSRARRIVGTVWHVGVVGMLFVSAGPGCLIPISSNPATADGGTGVTGGDGGTGTGGTDAGYPDTPIPPGAWQNVTTNLANMPSICGNLTMVYNNPNEDQVIVGLASAGLWGSTNGGTSWEQLGTGSMVTIPNRPYALVFDPTTPNRYWESGIYGTGAGVFETSDDGNTYVSLGLHHNDLVSVDFTDPLRKTLAVGGHEDAQSFWLSTDGGQTWSDLGTNLPATPTCNFPYVINSTSYLLGCGEFSSTGIYSTTDSGTTWKYLTPLGGFGQPLVASDKSIYWPTLGGSNARSVDNGQTWTELPTPSIDNTIRLIELPDARLASLGTVNGVLTVIVSADHGVTWAHASAALPYSDARDVAYSPQEKAFFITHFSCTGAANDPVPSDAVMRFDWDYTKN